ncbi:MAG: Crp/Fnr family transcriptional regulator, partial [Chitinophagaceae bacterium]
MKHNIFSNAELSEEQLGVIESRLKYISVSKGELLLRESQSVPNQFYVLKGCLRTYHIDNTGKEHTIQFAVNDWWISDYTAFFTGGLSSLNIECIQDAELVMLSRESMEKLYSEVPAVETYFRIKM